MTQVGHICYHHLEEGERRERGGREEGERRERGGREEGGRRERGGREEGERRMNKGHLALFSAGSLMSSYVK